MRTTELWKLMGKRTMRKTPFNVEESSSLKIVPHSPLDTPSLELFQRCFYATSESQASSESALGNINTAKNVFRELRDESASAATVPMCICVVCL